MGSISGEALLAGLRQLSQLGFTSALGFRLSSTPAHIVTLELRGTLQLAILWLVIGLGEDW